MNYIRWLFALLLLLLFTDVIMPRQEILTYTLGNKHKHKTTGNGNAREMYYPNLHLPVSLEKQRKTKNSIRNRLKQFTKIRDKWLLDLANEDPKSFQPESNSYWSAVAKRGYLFNMIGLSFIVLAFWVFLMRVAFGECGGYKMIVRHSVKSERYFLHAITFTGLMIFSIAYGYTAYNMLREKAISAEAGKSLITHNRYQIESSKNIYNTLKKINSRKLTVLYSSITYDKFRVGSYVKYIKREYKKSLEEAYRFRNDILETSSRSISERVLMLLFLMAGCVSGFIIGYKKRIKMVSLVVSLSLLFVIVFCFDSISSIFNYWSMHIDICNASVPAFDNRRYSFQFRPDHPFQKFMTCLDTKAKQNLVSQINATMIAQNALFIILRNYFEIEDKGVIMEKYLDSALNLERNMGKMMDRLKNATRNNKRNYALFKGYLGTITDLNKVYDEMVKLYSCYELNKWVASFNNSMCSEGLRYFYNMLWGFAWIILGIFVMVCSIYISESVVQSLRMEEDFYVKTKKLRFDWN